jgi:hypothetical protein
MKQQVQSGLDWIFQHLIAPPFVLLGFMLRPLDRHLARKGEAKLAQDVRNELGFLFKEHNGRIVPNQGVPFPRDFDYAFVTVAVENLFVRFCRGRGELDVHVASRSAPNELHELNLLLSVVLKKEDFKRSSISDLRGASRLLQPNISNLNQAFEGESAADLRKKLANASR